MYTAGSPPGVHSKLLETHRPGLQHWFPGLMPQWTAQGPWTSPGEPPKPSQTSPVQLAALVHAAMQLWVGSASFEWKQPPGAGVPLVLAKAGDAATVWIMGAAHAAAAVVTAALRMNCLRLKPEPSSVTASPFRLSAGQYGRGSTRCDTRVGVSLAAPLGIVPRTNPQVSAGVEGCLRSQT